MVTPSSHRTHHASNEYYIDRNFGEVFTIWDRVLGTHVGEAELQVYGHVHARDLWDPLHCQVEVLDDIFAKARTTPSLWRKFLCFVMPPGWNPADGAEFPLVPDKQPYRDRKYDCALGPVMSAYTALHFLPTLGAGIYVMMGWRAMPALDVVVWAAWLCFSTGVIGKLNDRNTWGVGYEFARLLSLLAVVAVVPPAFVTAPVAAGLCAAVAACLAVVLAHRDEFAPESEEERRKKYWIPEVGRGFQNRLNDEARSA